MADDTTLTLFVGRYSDAEKAKSDFDLIREHRLENFTTTFDAAVVERDEAGKVRITHKYEVPTRMGGWTGFLVGAALAAIFPPSALALTVMAAAGAGAGAVVGHFVRGVSRSDLKDIGKMLEDSGAALVAVIPTSHAASIREGMARADELVEHQVQGSTREVDAEIEKIAAQG